MESIKKLSSSRCYGGRVEKYEHQSTSCQCTMKFSVFIPPTKDNNKLPALFYLSGLTCNEDNFITKAGATRMASKLGLVLICPDTSPRGCGIEGEDDKYYIGTGAGFYINATEPKWSKNYNMYDYINEELQNLIYSNFPVDPSRISIFGHSMGGHGALIHALRNQKKYKSCSAFAPAVSPSTSPWGIEAFTSYLGSHGPKWDEFDTIKLLEKLNGNLEVPILIDQGTKDEFLEQHLGFPILKQKVKELKADSIEIREQEGYDHSYWFIQTFIDDHLLFHAKHLNIKV